ncbi:methyltransferase domain-containing protein [Rubrobacter marinus]|uniref:Methyltransferase domain-containing protein n=1 Tax=Rubrobacter marinus TaxID=2653852 RepID=A0A6G8Q101_9ACTN|nr:class I SAM-dependent methyltransferase [Rubrobacter marinus]QIN80143.1 methyltransferase domain-containing protein [Rubrobacter marinus]
MENQRYRGDTGEAKVGEAERFWEERYKSSTRPPDGRPSWALVRFAESLPGGRALDLGCARGDDAVWLARRGWRVVAVDISATALSRAAENAQTAGVSDHIEFQRHDLARTFPGGRFDLVSAQYLQSPVEFPREQVLREAASAVASDGLLLIVSHGSAPPWADPDAAFPTPEEELAGLQLDPELWQSEFVGVPERQATGPAGETTTVIDNVIALRRTTR